MGPKGSWLRFLNHQPPEEGNTLQPTPSILPRKNLFPRKPWRVGLFEHQLTFSLLGPAVRYSKLCHVCLASLCVRHTKLDSTTKAKCLVHCIFWNRCEESFGSWTQGCSSYELLVKYGTSCHSLVGTNPSLTWISSIPPIPLPSLLWLPHLAITFIWVNYVS